MVDRPQRHRGPSEDVSPVPGVQIRRGIPIAEHEKLRDAGKELDRRIGRLGIEDRLALLQLMEDQFPDNVIDSDTTTHGANRALSTSDYRELSDDSSDRSYL